MIAHKEPGKKVPTFNLDGGENGFLIELFKGEDGKKTLVYLSCVRKGHHKGYHLHRVREARYMCVKGKVKITLYNVYTKEKEEHILDSKKPERLFIPKNIATGIINIGDEDAWLINYPEPPYDPDFLDEQVEYEEEDFEKGIIK
ncbi:MAG: WxcM-like domain-containing protein [Candidatus Aenigmarchaeota archaeon]|nr:WxcM-like domain-containing protein [Candidatus Aenigmarchaeota archaeon]